MKELTQVRNAVTAALQSAGLTAMTAFPAERARAYAGAVAAVAVGTVQGRALGLCDYLGETRDKETGAVRELYGKQLEGQITVEIRAERAQTCEDGCETASGVLLGSLPEGIAPGELRWEAIAWERETGLFLRKGTLSCQALFTAWAGEDSEFLDFILKGAMKT